MTQIQLLDVSGPAQPARNTTRDALMAQVAQNAEDARQAFGAEADAFVLAYLADRPAGASGEAITDACKAAGIVPHDDRAFGPVYMRLSRRGLIVKVGTARRERGHGTAGGHIWARVR